MASPSAAPALAPWREQVGAFLVQRREREVNAHKAFFNAYAVLASTSARLLAENAGLRGQNETLRAEATLAGTSTAQGGPQVQARLLELQTEITGLYRAQAAAVQERLALSESNQRLKEESQRLAASHGRMEAAHRSSSDEIERLRALVKEKDARFEVLAGELTRTREQLAARAQEADTLRAENSSIVERVMDEKAHAAEQVQGVKDQLDSTRRERDKAQEAYMRAKAHIDALTRALADAAAGVKPGGVGVLPVVDAVPPAASTPSHVATAPRAAAVPPPTPASNPVASLFGTLTSAIRAAANSGTKPGQPAASSTAAAAHAMAEAEAATSTAVAGLMSDYVMAFLPVPTRVSATIRAHDSEVNAVRFSDTSRVVATACSDGNVGLFDAASGSRVGQLYSAVTGNACLCVDVCNGVVVAGCTDRSVRVWDVSTQRLTRSYTGHAGKVHAVVYLPNVNGSGGSGGSGRGIFASGSADRSVKLWDARDGRCLRTIDTKSIVNSIAVSADGLYVAVANQDSGVRMFDTRTGARMMENTRSHTAAVTSVQFSRGDGGARLLTASRDNTLRMLDARTLEPMHAFVPPSAALAGGASASSSVLGMLNSLSGAATGASGEAPSGIVMKQSTFRVPNNQSRAVLSPNNLMAACGGANGYVYTFSCETGDMEAELGNSRAAAAKARKERVAATAEGRAGGGGRASSAAAEEELFGGAFAGLNDTAAPGASRFDEPHEGRPVLCVDWSPDGSFIASADESGKLVLWSS